MFIHTLCLYMGAVELICWIKLLVLLWCVVFPSLQKYIAQLEPMLVTHVFPEFTNQLGYIRARVSPCY